MSLNSALEQHISAVRRKMILQHFVRNLAVALIGLGAVAWLTALVLRLTGTGLPGGGWAWLATGVALAALVALIVALRRAPSHHEAALAIDERLGLKEKFSTALAIHGSEDPFAQLALADAASTAARVDLQRKFPLSWPKTYYGVPAWALIILLTLWLVPRLEFAQRAEAQEHEQQQADQRVLAEAQQIIQQTTNALDVLPADVAERDEFLLARDQLTAAREAMTRDPTQARQTAREAQQALAEAIRNQIERGETYAQARENARNFRNLTPPQDASGPVADAHRAMANADFEKAMEELEKAVENFNQMTREEQEQQAEQMQNLAQALQQMAQNPQVQQQMQQQMQQMGMNQQQAQQAQQLMQQAAQGDQQAAQQLQQMAQQAMQQMNNGQGPTQAQQQQMQQMMNQMQQQAGSQAQAQQMQQMAQQMAQAMQQAAQQGQQQQGGQGQQAQANQGEGQGGEGQGGGEQGMQDAAQQMQDALAQMQAVQQDAQQMQAAQGMCQGGGDGQGGQAGGAGQGGGQGAGQDGQNPGQGAQAGNAQWQPGDAQGQGAGMGGPGQGAGGRAELAPAPFSFTPEVSKSHDDESGRIVASSLIKADALKGESVAEVQQIVESETREATDEVDQQRISRQAQRAVREYFQTLARDAGVNPPQPQQPATQP